MATDDVDDGAPLMDAGGGTHMLTCGGLLGAAVTKGGLPGDD